MQLLTPGINKAQDSWCIGTNTSGNWVDMPFGNNSSGNYLQGVLNGTSDGGSLNVQSYRDIIPSSNWIHIVFTQKYGTGPTYTAYCNGVSSSITNLIGANTTFQYPITTIGFNTCTANNYNSTNMNISNWRFYERVLTATEVNKLYANKC